MKKLLLSLFAIASVLMFSGCSEQVPPAHYGKKLTPDGYLPEVLPPGKHWIGFRESLIMLDGSTHIANPTITVTMKDVNKDGSPRPGLEMDFGVSLRYKLKDDPSVINTIFNDIVVSNNMLTGDEVYNVYGRVIVENRAREILAKYTPEEALANRKTINVALEKEIRSAFSSKPLKVSDIVITSMNLPKVIKDRIKKNKDKELKLAEAQAQQAIDLAQRDNEIILAQKEAEKRLIDAEASAAENKALNKGLSDKVLDLRKLEIQKIYASAWHECMSSGKCGQNTIFMPFEAMQSQGAQMRMYQK